MKTYNSFARESVTKLFEKHEAFFAFSQAQFDEKAKKDVKYARFSSGLIVPSKNAEQLMEDLNNNSKAQKEEYLKKYSKQEIIWAELANHEAGYTMDWTDAFEAVKHFGITEEEVAAEYKLWLKDQLERDNI